MNQMLGWHFLAVHRRLQFGAHEVVEPGHTYIATGPLVLCSNGMHACRRALDALEYAPGPISCRVLLAGEIIHGADKTVARSRTVLWMVDATPILHEFALSVATDALELTDETDPRPWAALDVKTRWLRGQATNQELAAARDATGDATGDDARDSAGDAAWTAAWDSAYSAAREANRSAIRAAAQAATRAVAGEHRRLGWAAAWDSAWDAYNVQLETMLESLK